MNSKRYLWFPIKVKWVKPLGNMKSSWFKKHGWQVGWDGLAMGVFGWTFHFGRIKVCFGSSNFKKKPHKQKKIPIKDRD